MKKFDIVIIIGVLVIGVFLFSFYYKKFNVNTDDAKVTIKYQNMTIAEIDYDKSLNYQYTIYGEDYNKLIVVIEQDGEEIDRVTYNVNLSKNIRNRIILTYEKIYMDIEPHDHDRSLDWPNCPDKNCTRMYMDASRTLPIVCINGIYVEFVAGEEEIPVPVS